MSTDHRYTYVEMSKELIEAVWRIIDAFEQLHKVLTEEPLMAEPRCKSIALTNLEQACMWAVKSVSDGGGND